MLFEDGTEGARRGCSDGASWVIKLLFKTSEQLCEGLTRCCSVWAVVEQVRAGACPYKADEKVAGVLRARVEETRLFASD